MAEEILVFAIQLGTNPSDWKPMRSIGAGVNEIRIHAENEYRVLYVAKYAEAVYSVTRLHQENSDNQLA